MHGASAVYIYCLNANAHLPESRWNISPTRILTGDFETSLNAPGFSISLCNLTAAARGCETDATKLLELFDAPTTATSWPNVSYIKPLFSTNGTNGHQIKPVVNGDAHTTKIQVGSSLLESAIRSGCEAAIASEPNLTKWDMILGDGDCGEAVSGVCQGM